ncbi:MAG: cytochrome b/b6 domain-containing protein [Paracoccaceae bacterium]|nr:cytochrome b/b6 domain-containing protein [Paracoccaceae bacterium]
MSAANDTDGFGWVSRTIHWAMALGVIGALGFGTYIARMEVNLSNLWMFAAHKTVGITLLALLVLRVVWHLVSRPPEPLPAAPWKSAVARWAHRAFYLLLLAVPLSGWVASSATGIDTVVFGRWTLPAIAPASEAWEEAGFAVHSVLTKLLALLILLHIAGAVTRRDGTLRRMIAGRAA